MSRLSPGIAGDLLPRWATPGLSAPVAWPLLATLLLHASIVIFLLFEWPSSREVIEPPGDEEPAEPDVVMVTLAQRPPLRAPALPDSPGQVQNDDTQPGTQGATMSRNDGVTDEVLTSKRVEGLDQGDTVQEVSGYDVDTELERLLGDEILAPPSEGPAGDEYAALIQRRVERYWSRPPDARNGMEVLLEIELTSLGDVAGVALLRSSGSPAFDHSAASAVRRAGPFNELQELPRVEFEQNFRRFKLLFKPEDLRY